MKGQTIETIEQDYWKDPGADASGLIRNLHLARKKNIDELSIEDLRLLIGQNSCLSVTIPLAINILKENPFSEGNYYQGDLLNSVLCSDPAFWSAHPALRQSVRQLSDAVEQYCDVHEKTKRQFLEALHNF